MARITIGIDEKNWKKLMQLKLDKSLTTFDDVIDYLLKQEKKK